MMPESGHTSFNRAAVGYRLALGLRRDLQRIARIKAEGANRTLQPGLAK
ncbi:MAG: hypothetical protein HWD57_08280 [Candidatus Accumulibacter cognatus]|uniref:Uncharacterized protein n=1 Tax=Candidatus Accumulibacter cognatus TaxID=2954383 RepID=A0A7D5SDD2_9PROT|nr:MAG: hypothetical protein HWD57_08280 [Candidatus Accumulibacter cognatus]